MRVIVRDAAATGDASFGAMADRAREAVEALGAASDHMLRAIDARPEDALAGATPYLRLFGLARGATLLLKGALVAQRDNDAAERRIALARFFSENLAVAAPGLARAVIDGAGSVTAAALLEA